MASPGKLLFEIEPAADLKLTFDVPQTDLPAVKQGLAGALPGRRSVASSAAGFVVSGDEHRADEASGDAAAGDPNPFTSGAYVPVSVVLERYAKATLIPRSAVIADPSGEPHVFVVEENRLQAQKVSVLGYDGEQAAVHGLAPGREVAVHTYLGWAQLASGEKVKAIR